MDSNEFAAYDAIEITQDSIDEIIDAEFARHPSTSRARRFIRYMMSRAWWIGNVPEGRGTRETCPPFESDEE